MELITIVLVVQVVMLTVMAVRSPSLRPIFRAPLLLRIGGLLAAWVVTGLLGEGAGVAVGWTVVVVAMVVPVVAGRWLRRLRGRDDHLRSARLHAALAWLGGGTESRRGRYVALINEAVQSGRVGEVAALDDEWRRTCDTHWRPLFVAVVTGSPDAAGLARVIEPGDALAMPLAVRALCQAGHVGEAVERYAGCVQLHRVRHLDGLHQCWATLLAHTGRLQPLTALLGGPLASEQGRRAVSLRSVAAAAQLVPPGLTATQRAVVDGIEADAAALVRLTPPTAFAVWRPMATWLAVAAIVVGLLNQLRMGAPWSIDTVVAAGARVTGLSVPEAHQWWRCLTAMFVHGGWVHVGFNTLSLLVLGPVAEWRIGRAGAAGLFLGGGVIAFALTSRWHDGPTVAVGASGGIMALLGALVVTSLVVRRAGSSAFAGRELRFWAAIVVLQVVLDRFVANVDGAAHLTGLAFGGVLTAVLLRIPRVRLAR